MGSKPRLMLAAGGGLSMFDGFGAFDGAAERATDASSSPTHNDDEGGRFHMGSAKPTLPVARTGCGEQVPPRTSRAMDDDNALRGGGAASSSASSSSASASATTTASDALLPGGSGMASRRSEDAEGGVAEPRQTESRSVTVEFEALPVAEGARLAASQQAGAQLPAERRESVRASMARGFAQADALQSDVATPSNRRGLKSSRTLRLDFTRKRSKFEEPDQQEKRVGDIGEEEVATVRSLFASLDRFETGALDREKLLICITELGLGGESAEERAEAAAICAGICAEIDESDDGGVSLNVVLLRVLPALRQALSERCHQYLQRCLLQENVDRSHPPSLEQRCFWARLAWNLEVDPLFYCTALCEAEPRHSSSRHWRRAPLKPGGMPSSAAASPAATPSSRRNALLQEDWDLCLERSSRAMARCREAVSRAVLEKERTLKQAHDLDTERFRQLRRLVLELNSQLVDGYLPERKGGVAMLLRELGVTFSRSCRRLKFGPGVEDWTDTFFEMDVSDHERVDFRLLLDLCYQCRQVRLREIVPKLEAFLSADGGQRRLSVVEASNLLVYVGLHPQSREEQREVERIILELDREGDGFLDRRDAPLLCASVAEQFQRNHYKDWFERGLELDLLEEKVRERAALFDESDLDAEGRISFKEMKQTLSRLGKVSDSDELSAAFSKCGFSENVALSFVDFLCVLERVPCVEADAGAEDFETPITPAVSRLRSMLTKEAPWAKPPMLRRALILMKLPKLYVRSLPDEALLPILADYNGVPADLFDEGKQALGARLGIKSVGELLRRARVFGEIQVADWSEGSPAYEAVARALSAAARNG
eukprot:TRINITY_DN27711_c0_g1_i2.p1 TRINITY_DN27711_c0_g1~~TRINITY_DN27711_c0_g1_i2.p1  ORF type:complete len:830 (-),score=193.93 TRINITY_DN27711_c0_g1_i2:38-2527(-)